MFSIFNRKCVCFYCLYVSALCSVCESAKSFKMRSAPFEKCDTCAIKMIALNQSAFETRAEKSFHQVLKKIIPADGIFHH